MHRGRVATLSAWWPLLLVSCAVSFSACSSPTATQQRDDEVATTDTVEDNENVQQGAVLAMSGGDLHSGPHMELTSLRPMTKEDTSRARDLLATLREVLAKYENVDVARRDGYTPFVPQIEQEEYHFTSVGRTFAAAVDFDAARPSSLLYEKHGDDWVLVGAMYTAPQGASKEELDDRVPLSYARWHLHVNICLPPLDMLGQVDWTRFGPQGSIATRQACDEAGGRFVPQVFGWMVHVYPFEDDPDDIWGVRH